MTYISNAIQAWKFAFGSEEEEKKFKLTMSIALLEVNRKEAFAKAVAVRCSSLFLQ